MYSFYCHQNKEKEIGPSPILSIIRTVTIVTMLNLNGNNGHGLKNFTRKENLINSPTLDGWQEYG